MENSLKSLGALSYELAGECMEFTGTRNPAGYGQVTHEGKQWLTHRLAWEQANGPIPEGMLVCHQCDNPSCVNVEHLFLGTHQDNSDDKVRKGRHPGRPKAPNHVANGVVELRAPTGEVIDLLKIPEVARLLHISDKTVYRMCEHDILPHARVGLKGAIRVPREAVEKYVNDQLSAVAGE